MYKPQQTIPLSIPHLAGNEAKYLADCVKSTWVSTAGPWVSKFEQGFAQAIQAPAAVAVSSGTAAIHLALLVAGIQPDDEVLIPTLTFIAPVNCIRYVGANPVFMDCDQHLNLDVRKVGEFLRNECRFENGCAINKRTGKRVRAVIPVHLFGHPVDMDPLMKLAEEFRLTVIEDATESLGGYFRDAAQQRYFGTIGHFGCFSFNGNKIITTGGGGMLVAKDPKALEQARYLSCQAKDDNVFYVHNEIGYNYRLTSLQAALGIAQLEQLDRFISIKRKNFQTYLQLLADHPIGSFVMEPTGSFSNHWLYNFRFREGLVKDLRGLVARLDEMKIETRPLWKLNHEQRPYKNFQAYQIEQAPSYYSRTLSLPSNLGLTDRDIEYVVQSIKAAIA